MSMKKRWPYILDNLMDQTELAMAHKYGPGCLKPPMHHYFPTVINA